MIDQSHYTMHIQWSDSDEAFLVTLPEWRDRVFGPVSHGETYEEAGRNGQTALQLLIESAIEHGESLPTLHPYLASARV